jgi:hypothetical protein
VRTVTRKIVAIGAIAIVMSMLIGTMTVNQVEAAKPYEGTTVKVIVNAEYVKYAMTLIEKDLLD